MKALRLHKAVSKLFSVHGGAKWNPTARPLTTLEYNPQGVQAIQQRHSFHVHYRPLYMHLLDSYEGKKNTKCFEWGQIKQI